MKRLSRPCYDKPHRCPGWNGGGMLSAKVERCVNGRVSTRGEEHPGNRPWRFGYCNTCDVVTWPVVTRWLDPRWLAWIVPFRIRQFRYNRL